MIDDGDETRRDKTSLVFGSDAIGILRNKSLLTSLTRLWDNLE